MDGLQPVGRVVDVRRWIGARVDRAGAVAVGPERDATVVGVGDGGRAGEGIRPRYSAGDSDGTFPGSLQPSALRCIVSLLTQPSQLPGRAATMNVRRRREPLPFK